jgi:hypothetical protein
MPFNELLASEVATTSFLKASTENTECIQNAISLFQLDEINRSDQNRVSSHFDALIESNGSLNQ